MRWLHVRPLLITLVAVNVVGATLNIVLTRLAIPTLPSSSLRAGTRFPTFGGVDLLGRAWSPTDAPCTIIRITDENCIYCKRDTPSYDVLLNAARMSSCEVIEMAPTAGGLVQNSRAGVVQLQFIDTDLGPALFPFSTPHTIVLDRAWLVVMTRRGVFDTPSLSHAVATLKSLGLDDR